MKARTANRIDGDGVIATVPPRKDLLPLITWKGTVGRLTRTVNSRFVGSLRLAGHWLAYAGVRAAITVINLVPLAVCDALSRVGALLCADVFGIRRQVVAENLRRAFPEWTASRRRQVARGMWRHLLMMACESIHAQRRIRSDNWRHYIQYSEDNAALLDECFKDARGCMLLSCHYGNFEVAGMFGRFGYPRYTIARPLDNPFLDRYINDLRARNGQKVLPKLGIAADVARFLQAGNNVAVLGDQYGGPRGCRVDFFGRPASYHKSIALFALTARVPIVVAYLRRADRPMHFELRVAGVCDPEDPRWQDADVRQVTQWYNDLFEDMIRTAPEQYWWLHRRWKDTRKKKEA